MIARAWGATAGGALGWTASLTLFTHVIQAITAVLALISTVIGLWLFWQKLKAERQKKKG